MKKTKKVVDGTKLQMNRTGDNSDDMVDAPNPPRPALKIVQTKDTFIRRQSGGFRLPL